MINQKIRGIRMLKKYTQEYMAERLGISPKSYSKIECGKTNITTNRLTQIAAILQVEIEDILQFDEEDILIKSRSSQKTHLDLNKSLSEVEIALYERLLAEKEAFIQSLKTEIDLLRGKK